MPTPPVTLLRLLVLALLSSALVWVVPSSASAACSCTTAVIRSDTEQLARNANSVFTGTVVGSTVVRTDGTATAVFTAEVTVELIYKGDIRESTVKVETVRGTSECDLGRLEAGRRYAFFVEAAEDTLVADGCGGTQPARPKLLVELEALYGAGEPPRGEDQPAEVASIEPVAGVDDPPTFTRAAAPGGAMVLVGLLGLVVVRRLARR